MRKKRTPVRKSARAVLRLTDFFANVLSGQDAAALPIQAALDAFDVTAGGGTLRDGLGINKSFTRVLGYGAEHLDFNTESKVKAVWYFRHYHLPNSIREDQLILWMDGRLWSIRFKEPNIYLIPDSAFGTKPAAVNYRLNGKDVIIFCSPSDTMLVYDGRTSRRVPEAPNMTSMAVHYERLFATTDGDRSQVWFSDDLDPTCWNINLNDAGFIELADERGASVKVVSFLDSLYVFRENGISRISAYGDQSQFYVTHLFTAGGRIRPETVAVAGDRILFLADGGLYAFDGADTARLLRGLSERILPGESDLGVYHNGKYYFCSLFSYRTAVADGSIADRESFEDTLFEYDILTGGLRLMRGVRPDSMVSVAAGVASGVVIAYGGKLRSLDNSGMLSERAQRKVWRSALSDLGSPGKDKRIFEFYVRTATDIEVVVESDRERRRHLVKGGAGKRRVRTSVRGCLFSVGIFSESPNTEVSDIYALAEIS